jgi:hypothetical protein
MKTSTAFKNLLQIRKNTIVQLEKHSDNVTIIPDGFSNSLIWNAAHCVVTLQLLAYKLSGLEMHISDELANMYKKGTKASTEKNTDINELKNLLTSTVSQLKNDYEKGIFNDYSPYKTSFGITLNSIEEVISFNNIHESLHLGYMMAMSKNIQRRN